MVTEGVITTVDATTYSIVKSFLLFTILAKKEASTLYVDGGVLNGL
jgi:hypothetical protein